MIKVSRAWWGEPRKSKVPIWPKASGSRQGDPAPQRKFYLIPSHRLGGFMGNPQPRGFRQALPNALRIYLVGPG